MSTTITALPLPSSALPTPPFSPSGPVLHPSKASHMLDALIAHYQRERMWVKQTQDMIVLARYHQLPAGSSPVSDSAGSPGVDARPLWQRRKSRHSLRLSNLAHSKLSNRLLMHDACGTKVLELFADLLDARIESCKRVENLVAQSAHRRRLLLRYGGLDV